MGAENALRPGIPSICLDSQGGPTRAAEWFHGLGGEAWQPRALEAGMKDGEGREAPFLSLLLGGVHRAWAAVDGQEAGHSVP